MTPRELPVAGARNLFGGALAFKRDQLGFLAENIRRHGDLFRFSPLGVPMVLANHPDHIQHILVDGEERYDKDATIFKVVRPVLRNGLISIADKEQWSRQRRMMAPHFTPRTVAGFAENMTSETVRMLERWERRPRSAGDVLDVTDEIGQLALRIVNRSLFSADVSRAAQAFERAFAAANNVLGSFFRFPFPPLSWPTTRRRRLRRAIDDMDHFVSGVIRERLSGEGAGQTNPQRPDLLTLLLHSVDDDGTAMDLEQLHHEVLNLCIGAFETTTNTLSWAFYLLARHPQAEQRLHAEVDQVLAGRVPRFEDLPQLTYTRRVIDETLRIYSPAYQTMRHAREEDVIAGYRIPSGSNVLLNSYLLHRHPEFWPDPDRFDPENFAPERVAARPKHAYIPFGSGRRVCIGKHFALTELTLALATVARGHRLLLPDGAPVVEPEPLITLHPRGGVHLRLVRR
ncbi:cytochrome P450 [Streptomyces sp. NBC_00557]|uniref:cytochrome P450 n=1 Tax=Streptomyces sp. NBC_00557 TaxID=2975776 RepID=UPI002E80392D|nr:cytochrome P450 [Streptomyces sp. NBC_00557]WUC40314.1 cytochrome P450 [Streptomyces sp. NBC_00557]